MIHAMEQWRQLSLANAGYPRAIAQSQDLKHLSIEMTSRVDFGASDTCVHGVEQRLQLAVVAAIAQPLQQQLDGLLLQPEARQRRLLLDELARLDAHHGGGR